jgi:anti-sigma factor RsiW
MTTSPDGTVVNEIGCRATVLRLWDYLDHALADSQRLEVDQHLRDCSACAEHFGFARAFLDALPASWPRPIDTEPLRRRVVERLREVGFSLP